MMLGLENIEQENKTKIICIIVLIVILRFPQYIYAAEEQWQTVPESNYAEILDLIAFRAKANYEEISSWQGRMNILETSHYYGDNATMRAPVDKSFLKGDSKHICSIDKTLAEFVVDMRKDKLYSNVEPSVQFKAVDLDQIVPMAKGVSIRGARTILTPVAWIHYDPNGKYFPKFNDGKRPEKAAFIDTSQDVKGLNGNIRDPRVFFNSGGESKKLWDTLLRIKDNINDLNKERVAGYPNIEINSLDSGKGIKYRIITTWKGGENYATKYIRSLLEVDEAIGFNTTQVEITNPDGVKLASLKYTYKDFGGIYIPKTIQEVFLDSKGNPTMTSEITIETTSVNKPLPEDTFTIKSLGIEEDTLVTDNVKKAEFRFSKGNLVPLAQDN